MMDKVGLGLLNIANRTLGRQDFLREYGGELLDGLLSKGYVEIVPNTPRERLRLTLPGRRCLTDKEIETDRR